jgi:hypothetical protein
MDSGKIVFENPYAVVRLRSDHDGLAIYVNPRSTTGREHHRKSAYTTAKNISSSIITNPK